MVDDANGAARLFATAQGNLLEILYVRKWRPLPGETGKGAVNNGSAGDLCRNRLNKTGLYRRRQGRQRGLAWLHAHACAFLEAEQSAYLVPAGGSCRPSLHPSTG